MPARGNASDNKLEPAGRPRRGANEFLAAGRGAARGASFVFNKDAEHTQPNRYGGDYEKRTTNNTVDRPGARGNAGGGRGAPLARGVVWPLAGQAHA